MSAAAADPFQTIRTIQTVFSGSGLSTGSPFAHRGLWSPDGPPENSLAAFDAACVAGYGMELDVRLSADGEAVVFHDESLDRMTDRHGSVRRFRTAELVVTALRGSSERIPTLAQALAAVAGRTPVLVELKTRVGEEGPLERRVAALLCAYRGPAAAIGFNPAALAAVAHADPSIPRGLNIAPHVDDNADMVEPRSNDLDAGMAVAQPHFLGLHHTLLTGPRPHHLPIVGWTIRNPADQRAVQGACDTIMFEGFRA